MGTGGAKEFRVEPGSFRDAKSRVFYVGEDVYRGISEGALREWTDLSRSPLWQRLADDRKVVATELVDITTLPRALPGPYAGVLRHDRIPFVSYPYEWSFSQLKDAALFYLGLMRVALDEGFVLKDATPYNVQWVGSRPVFIDVTSFERIQPGQPWIGYRQFCMQFLYPLVLAACRGVDFQPLLRGRLEGVTPRECRALLRLRDLLRRGMLTHVVLHSRLDRREDRRTGGELRQELRRAGFHSGLIRRNVDQLERIVRRLEWQTPTGAWSKYTAPTYTDADAERKAAFVRESLERDRPEIVWDLGCNDGRFSRLAAEHSGTVIALDSDHGVVDALYLELREAGDDRILPLVVDVVDPSPALGWRGAERKALLERGRPSIVLCLALVHHLAITRNVPLAEIVAWLASLDARIVVEFPTPEDEMVCRLLDAKDPNAMTIYGVEEFEGPLREAFAIERREQVSAGTRILYVANPRR